MHTCITLTQICTWFMSGCGANKQQGVGSHCFLVLSGFAHVAALFCVLVTPDFFCSLCTAERARQDCFDKRLDLLASCLHKVEAFREIQSTPSTLLPSGP